MSRNSGGGAAKPASILSGVNLKKPVHQGYLYKEGHEHLAFNYRYFALYRTFLVYYDDEHNFKRDVSRGTIEVHGSKFSSICHMGQGIVFVDEKSQTSYNQLRSKCIFSSQAYTYFNKVQWCMHHP